MTDKITTVLDSMKKLRTDATSGPWRVFGEMNVDSSERGIASCGGGTSARYEESKYNTKFIAASPTLCEKYDAALRVAIEVLERIKDPKPCGPYTYLTKDAEYKMELAKQCLEEIESLLNGKAE